ncbi:MAG: hypothetical protein ABI277_16800 [Burkholderiaceae bacterium]
MKSAIVSRFGVFRAPSPARRKKSDRDHDLLPGRRPSGIIVDFERLPVTDDPRN